jgi:hypothetical protein
MAYRTCEGEEEYGDLVRKPNGKIPFKIPS